MKTGKGRDILLRTKDAVEKMGFEVIYGDTDSLMINTNTQEIQKVYQIGNKIKTEVNKMYRLLELEIDGVFRFLLLLKKKKYAALLYNVKPNGGKEFESELKLKVIGSERNTDYKHVFFYVNVEIETTMELKGLDIVRRDWAPVAAQTARAILDEIMTEQVLDDKIFKIVKILNDKAEELKSGQVQLKDLLITKQLAKNPEEYKGRQGLYHVQVAIKMNEMGKLSKKFKNGDTVPYLFCTDGKPHHPAELTSSKVKKEVKKEPVLTEKAENGESGVTEVTVKNEEEPVLEPDPMYYLTQQIHPVVSRICEPIPGLDAARIAESLGLDPTSYKKRKVYEQNAEDGALGEISDAEKYRECERFSFRCANLDCRKENVIESPYILQVTLTYREYYEVQ
jgi:DNA polymerase alpha subunit A